ncbi:hypothetical protein CHUAL_006506 [Chamberlinius hualienensis]
MFIIFLIASFGSAVAQQETKCDNRYYNGVPEAITGISNCTYPIKNINSTSIEAALPALSSQSLCPVNNDGSINEVNFKQILKIVEDGLKQSEICGEELNPIFFRNFTINANQTLPPPLTGECNIVKNNNNNITNIKNTHISFINSPDIGKANVSISVIGLTYSTTVGFKLKLYPEQKGSIFLDVFVQVNFDITAECSFSVNKNNSTFTIDFANVIARPEVGAFNNPLLAGVRAYFSNKITEYVQNSTLPKIFTIFIATMVGDGLAASAKKC